MLESVVTVMKDGQTDAEKVIAQIYILDGNGQSFVNENSSFDKALFGSLCENTDVELAFELYENGGCGKQFIRVT